MMSSVSALLIPISRIDNECDINLKLYQWIFSPMEIFNLIYKTPMVSIQNKLTWEVTKFVEKISFYKTPNTWVFRYIVQ